MPTCLFFDGAEHDAYDAALAAGIITSSGTASISITNTAARLHRSGTYGGDRAWHMASSVATADFIHFTGWGNTGRDTCFYWYNTALGSTYRYVQWYDAATVHMTFMWYVDGSWEARRGTTAGTIVASGAIGSIPRTASTGVWFRFVCIIADAGGTFDIYANGALISSFTGDTRNGANAYWNGVRFGHLNSASGASTVDDLCIFSDAATGEYFDVSPDANSDVAVSLTPSAGVNNYANIEERPATATEYNSKTPAVAGDGDTYGHGGTTAMGFTPASIVAVKVSAMFKRDGVITSCKLRLKSGGTTYLSSALAGGAAGTSVLRQNIWTTDPATATNWTEAGFNAAAFGAEGA
jgi:hypothetical protein